MEVTWQSLHLIDTTQTLSVARDPDCYDESVSDPIIGKHPSQRDVLLWMFAASALHFIVTDWLAMHEHPNLTALCQALSLGSTGYWVMHNTMDGVRPFGHNEPGGTCVDLDGESHVNPGVPIRYKPPDKR